VEDLLGQYVSFFLSDHRSLHDVGSGFTAYVVFLFFFLALHQSGVLVMLVQAREGNLLSQQETHYTNQDNVSAFVLLCKIKCIFSLSSEKFFLPFCQSHYVEAPCSLHAFKGIQGQVALSDCL